MTDFINNSRIVFDFIRSPVQRLSDVENGIAPRESLLGYIQLQERGWKISTSDDRWSGFSGAIRNKIKRFIELPSIRMIKHWQRADIIVVTTRISLVLVIIAKLLNKKFVFLDAMCQEVPKRLWRKFIIKRSLRLADAVICFSNSQAQHWSAELNLPKETFIPLDYFVDHEFYKLPPDYKNNDKSIPSYILSVGRDPHRDFTTLVSAVDALNLDLKLVTLPYLIPDSVKDYPRVEVLDNLSYEELFTVYSKAIVVVVPIKRRTTFMSGIRATMEAMALGIPVVASRVSGMEDYFSDGEELLFYEPENYKSLIQTIQKFSEDDSIRSDIVLRARKKIINSFTLTKYADALEKVFKLL